MTVVGRTTAKAFAKNVFVDQERKSEDRRRPNTALDLTPNDKQLAIRRRYSHDVARRPWEASSL